MKKNLKIISIIMLILFVVSITSNSNIEASDVIISETDFIVSDSISMLVSSPPLNFYSDTDFETSGLPGNGSEENPYRIENLLIQDSFGYGIYVSGVTVHFVIQNCMIINSLYEGVIIMNTDNNNANFSNNIIQDCGNVGLLVQNTVGVTIEDNILYNNEVGIEIRYATDGYIFNNTCEENRQSGMLLKHDLQTSTLENNTLINNAIFGMDFLQANGSHVYNNTFVDNGLNVNENSLEDYLKYDIEDNILNGQKIGYFTNTDSLSITSPEYCQIFLYNCTDILIENQEFERSLFGVLSYESSNCTFSNNLFDNNLAHGIDLYNSYDMIIESNVFNNNSNGLNFEDSPELTIRNNRFYSDGLVIEDANVEILSTYILDNNTVNDKPLGFFLNEHDLILSDSIQYGEILILNCTNIEVYNQNISDTQIGVTIAFSNSCRIQDSEFRSMSICILAYDCDNLTIINNIMEENYDGILALYIESSEFSNNVISNNLDDAIELVYGYHVKLNNNTLEHNAEWALLISYNDYLEVTNSTIRYNLGGNFYMQYSYNSLIKNVTCANSEWGIYLFFVEDTSIHESKILNNNVDGIHLRNTIYIDIYASNISSNFYGIKVKLSDYCTFTHNTISENHQRGISLDAQCNHNLIHHNYFINNQLDDPTGMLSYGYDDGYNNTLYDITTQEGNWWSNIESYAYRIAGYGYSVDIYPLNPQDPPTPTPTPTPTETNWTIILPGIFALSTMVILRVRKKKRR